MFLVNSRLGLVCATPSGSGYRSRHPTEVPLLPKLRGHVAEFLNEGSLTRLWRTSTSTCVGFGYGHPQDSLEDFSWWTTRSHFRPNGPASRLGILRRDLPHRLPPRFHLSYHSQAGLWPPVTPIAPTSNQWYRTIPRFAITYASRPRLRSRLTLGGLALPKEP